MEVTAEVPLVHYVTACLRQPPGSVMTTEAEKVTCRECLRIMRLPWNRTAVPTARKLGDDASIYY